MQDGDDDLLVERARAGSLEAFEELVRRFTRLVYARAYLETGDQHRAEDLVQETFLIAHRSIRSLGHPKGFRSWLLAIARNACVDAARRGLRRKRSGPQTRLDSLDALRGADSEPPEEAERAEARGQVLAILRSMPQSYREPILMRYMLGCDYRTIAAQLGLGYDVLRGLLNRGMRLLRDEIKRISTETP